LNQANVVSLKVRGRQQASLPPVIQNVRQNAKRQIGELMQNLFNGTDDALFEMADRARNDTDETMYFESMRQVRLHRRKIGSEFLTEFDHGFSRVFAISNRNPEAAGTGLESDDLSLVQKDELELSVAVAGIVSKVTSQFSLPIMQLTKRLDHLAKNQPLTERLNPLGPECLSQAFVYAIDTLNVDIKIRIILLKLFERFVMECLGPAYEQANALLAKSGVLPDLGRHEGKRQSARETAPAESTPKNAEAADPPSTTDANSDLSSGSAAVASASNFGVIQGLLANARTTSLFSGRGFSGEPLTTPQLVSVLCDAQSEHFSEPLDMVLFDYILNDRNLAIPMKALIGRLQIPIVKLAIMDKTFFEKSGHPARQLLNALSSAGIGWSSAAELKRDALYNKIESIVLQVLNGFNEDLKIFSELLSDLQSFTKQDEHKRGLVEQRVKATEIGKAKTVAAKETVQKLINDKASGLRLPPEIGRFISDTWSKVLVYACVTDGTRSGQWQEHTRALDDLLWCLQPLENLDDAERRDAMITELLGALDIGMQHLKLADHERLEIVDAIHTELTRISSNDRAYLEDDLVPTVDERYEQLDEIVLTAPHERLQPEVVKPPEPEFIEQIDALREGIWIEFVKEDGDRIRCKLAAVIAHGERYVFVNRRGMKVLEKSKTGLAAALKEKNLTILEEAQVFDRALQAVIGNLRTMKRSPQAVPE
jgi:hypothetical protein